MDVRKFGFDRVKKRLAKAGKPRNDKQILRLLSYIGEELCEHARNITPGHSSGGYDDQTGNLRSSIGYRIYKDGDISVDGGFKSVGGVQGVSAAREALDKYELAHPISVEGWTLVIVAGMSYARYVEAKGFNVLHLTKIEMLKKIAELKKDLE